MRDEFIIYGDSGNDSTPDEPWMLEREAGHYYCAQADFAVEELGQGNRACLVIGSPLFEAIELRAMGWEITYVDVRQPPPLPCRVIRADAAFLDLPTDSFAAVSSTACLCHAGMGRYGDPIVPDADERILKNIHRVLKKGARAAITFGPVAHISMPMRVGNCHRVYNWDTLHAMVQDFRVIKEQMLDSEKLHWTDKFLNMPISNLSKYYASMLLEKP